MVREMSREQPPEPLDFFIWTVEVTKFEALSVSPFGFLFFFFFFFHFSLDLVWEFLFFLLLLFS